MFRKVARMIFGGRRRAKATKVKNAVTLAETEKNENAVQSCTKHSPNWQAVLTAPVDQLCEAPSADTVRYAYDLYAEGVYGPFAEREARMAARLARIQAGFATLVARAPDLVEAAFTEHPQVFADLRRLPKRGRP